MHCIRLREGTFLNAFARTRKLVPVQEIKPSVSAPGCMYLQQHTPPQSDFLALLAPGNTKAEGLTFSTLSDGMQASKHSTNSHNPFG